MRKLFLFLGLIILTYFTFGFYLAFSKIEIFNDNTSQQTHPIFYDYRGVSHVVTSFSKGSASPSAILLQAASAELDFLFFTDLNILERPYNLSGYQGRVFTFSNQKVSHLDSHILVYSQNSDFHFDSMGNASAQLHQHFAKDTLEPRNFISVLAHPFKQNHQWTGPYPKGLDGIEVVNIRHLWQQVWHKNKTTFMWSILTYPFNSDASLLRLIEEPHKEIELWDKLNQTSKTLGLLGNETTAKIFKVFGLNFTFPSYEKSFRFASNHILVASELTGQVSSDRKKIYRAFKGGNFYFAFDSLGSPKGFAAYSSDDQGLKLIGDTLSYNKNSKINIDLPAGIKVPFVVAVYKNGKIFSETKNQKNQITIDGPGVYRVVVKIRPKLPWPDRQKWFGWIYTNPLYFK